MEPPYQENQENQLWKKTGLDSAKSKILTESKFPNFPVTNFQNQQNQLSKRTGLTSLDLGQNLGPEQPELGPKLGPGPPKPVSSTWESKFNQIEQVQRANQILIKSSLDDSQFKKDFKKNPGIYEETQPESGREKSRLGQNLTPPVSSLTSLDLGQNLGPEQPELGPKLGPGPPYQENPKKKLRKRGRRLGPKLKRSKGLLAKSEFSKTKIWP